MTGNPWPPVVSKVHDHRNTLANILLHEVKKEYRQEKAKRFHDGKATESDASSCSVEEDLSAALRATKLTTSGDPTPKAET